MAKTHGKDSVFLIDDSSGSLRNISPYVTNVEFPPQVDMAETTCMTETSKTYLPGTVGCVITITGVWDDTATVGSDTVLGPIMVTYAGCTSAGGSLTYEYGPEGNGDGDIKYTGECFLASYQPSGGVGGAVTYTASIQCTDDISRTTFSA